MQQSELDELMAQSANDAILAVKEELGVRLELDEDSVELVDSVITQMLEKYPEQAKEAKTIFTLSNIFGAYLGEIFKKHVRGEWLYDISDEEAPKIFMKVEEWTFAFAGICYEKIVNDTAVSVATYYQQAAELCKNG